MPLYCECEICRKTFGHPKLPKEAQHVETHIGPRVRPLQAGEILCHFSRYPNLTELKSNEIHHIQQFHDADVCGISFTYHTVEKVPERFKAGIRASELAGPYRYDIHPDVANWLPLYASNESWRRNGQQVVLVVGCGGYLVFDNHRVATGNLVMGSYPRGGRLIAPPPPQRS